MKIVAAIGAIFFLGIQYLSYIGVVKINYSTLQDWTNTIYNDITALYDPLANLFSQTSIGAGFAGGLVLGLTKG
jgi:uncharacterized membrane protein (Fun14 family)